MGTEPGTVRSATYEVTGSTDAWESGNWELRRPFCRCMRWMNPVGCGTGLAAPGTGLAEDTEQWGLSQSSRSALPPSQRGDLGRLSFACKSQFLHLCGGAMTYVSSPKDTGVGLLGQLCHLLSLRLHLADAVAREIAPRVEGLPCTAQTRIQSLAPKWSPEHP